MKKPPLLVKSVSELVKLSGFPPIEHPTFTIIRVEELNNLPKDFFQPLVFNFYTIGLKKNLKNPVRYGRITYDFKNGVLGFTSPGQIIEIDEDFGKSGRGWMIVFQREFVKGHPLQKVIDTYGFFDYQVNEALHLSDKEEKTIENIFESTSTEYHNNMDRFSRNVILSYLELLLSYSDRFYSRQFITRSQVSSELLERFENLVKIYFQSEHSRMPELPTVTYFADALNVSANYLSDYMKSTTGKSTQEHIHLALIKKAEIMLLSSGLSVSTIAYDLGFEYPQYFSRLFKQKTGFTPKEFRANLQH